MGKVLKGNAIAIREASSLASLAWQKLETAAKAAIADDAEAPALRLIADSRGITAQISDEHGTSVVIQGGKISVTARPTEGE
jgi:hypothetical protein